MIPCQFHFLCIVKLKNTYKQHDNFRIIAEYLPAEYLENPRP